MEAKESVGTTTIDKPVLSTQFSGAPGDLMADLALLAKEQGQEAVVPTQTEVEPEQPVITEPQATAPVTEQVQVPEKFKGPDGSLDEERLAKSTQAALDRYDEIEKKMRLKEAEYKRTSVQTIPASIAPATPTAVPLTAFEIQVTNDLINEARNYGYEMPQGQAIAQARVQVKMAEARHSAEASLTEGLRMKLEDQERRQELEAIAKYDSSVLSPEGIEALSKIRDSKPWINNSPKPWTEAYDYYLAEQTKAARLSGKVLPTPTGLTAKAPPTPVGPSPRVVVQSKGPNLQDKGEIDSHLDKMSPDEMAKFFKSKGLRW